MLKILVTADNHLGRYYPKLLPDRLQERRKKLRNAFKETIDFAIQEKIDIYIQAGDLFDSSNPRNADLTFVAREFSRLKKNNIDIFSIGGNHDAPSLVDNDAFPIKIFEEVGLVKAFTSQSTINTFLWEKNGKEKILIGGLSHDARKRGRINPLERTQFSEEISKEKDLLKILTLHYSFENFAHPKSQEPQVSLGTLSTLPFNIFILGHLHAHNTYRFKERLVIIPGGTERLNFGEENIEPGFYFLILENKKIRYEHYKITPQPMRSIEIRLSEIPDENPTNSILDRIEKISQKDQLLRCILVGDIPLSKYQKLNFSKIIQYGNAINFLLDLDTHSLRVQIPESNFIPSLDWDLSKILNEITHKHVEESEKDKEIIIEAYEWIKDFLRKENIL